MSSLFQTCRESVNSSTRCPHTCTAHLSKSTNVIIPTSLGEAASGSNVWQVTP